MKRLDASASERPGLYAYSIAVYRFGAHWTEPPTRRPMLWCDWYAVQ